jgi:hypothetical protein
MESNTTAQLERILSAVLNETERAAEPPNDAVIQATKFLKNAHEATDQFIVSLFPGGVPLDGSFYKRLYRVASVIGFSDSGAEFVGHIWSTAMLALDEPNRETLLRSLPAGHEFFIVLSSFPFLLRTVRFEPSFLIDSFFEIRARIGNDLAQGAYWRGIEEWAAAFPTDAFQGLKVLLTRNLDNDGISIAAAILGSLRVAWEQDPASSSNHSASEELAHHSDIAKRLVYHRSWINTGWMRGISFPEFTECLRRMSAGSAEEQSEAFNFLRCLGADGRTEQTSLDFGVAWLTGTANSALPDDSKHWVSNIANRLAQRWVLDDTRLESLLPALLAIQPIPFDNKGTWMEIEHLLVNLLHKNRPQFERWLLALLDANPAGVIKHFREHGRFEYLCSEMVSHSAAHVTSGLFFSTVGHQRQFAFTVYDKVPFDSFPDGMLATLSDNKIALCLFESRRHFLQPEHTARFLTALHQRAEAGGPQLAKLFRDDLLYQAKNLPGAVLGGLKRVSKSALVQDVVREAEAYFEKLHAAHGSAINSMEIPGWRRALFIRSRRQSRDIETHKNEFSALSQFFSTSYLIYGSQGFRSCHDGEIGEFAPMKSVSVSMEAPRLVMIDPEGAVARDIEAGRSSDRLSGVITKKSAADQ